MEQKGRPGPSPSNYRSRRALGRTDTPKGRRHRRRGRRTSRSPFSATREPCSAPIPSGVIGRRRTPWHTSDRMVLARPRSPPGSPHRDQQTPPQPTFIANLSARRGGDSAAQGQALFEGHDRRGVGEGCGARRSRERFEEGRTRAALARTRLRTARRRKFRGASSPPGTSKMFSRRLPATNHRRATSM